jgi:hypothetical protein
MVQGERPAGESLAAKHPEQIQSQGLNRSEKKKVDRQVDLRIVMLARKSSRCPEVDEVAVSNTSNNWP